MRIRGGSAKGRVINAPKGLNTRPTADKVKEAIFNVISAKIADAKVLDLCAGSGNLALEALSRGASEAVMIEKDHKAKSAILDNIDKLGFTNKAKLLQVDVIKALQQLLHIEASFNIIFFDPPYDAGLYEPVLNYISNIGKNLVKENGVIVVECSAKSELADDFDSLSLRKESVYGDTKILYYQF